MNPTTASDDTASEPVSAVAAIPGQYGEDDTRW